MDQIDLKEMILPLVIIDVHEDAAKNPDYRFSIERLRKWEKEHGLIPAGAFVAMRTDWVKALARSREDGKQRRERRRTLSGLELARPKISLCGA